MAVEKELWAIADAAAIGPIRRAFVLLNTDLRRAELRGCPLPAAANALRNAQRPPLPPPLPPAFMAA
ncbi:MAG: hypothetical protein ACKOBY_04045 [Cyanobium sp.]